MNSSIENNLYATKKCLVKFLEANTRVISSKMVNFIIFGKLNKILFCTLDINCVGRLTLAAEARNLGHVWKIEILARRWTVGAEEGSQES